MASTLERGIVRVEFNTTKSRLPVIIVTMAVAVVLGACSSTKVRSPAPVVTRTVVPSVAVVPAGFYRVQPGDTLASIASRYGTDWRTLAQWNQLSNPDRLEIDQVLRVKPEVLTARNEVPAAAQTSAPPTASSGVVVKPVSDGAPSQAQAAPTKPMVREESAPAAPAAAIRLAWPAEGPLVSRFDGNTNKGVGIGGKLGSPVTAAADGRVVYAGAGLRGYGNLVIIKHDDTYLTAYAHNQALLVKEDQVVKQGQRIAEMGNTEADQVKLHFEVRQLGKPVDPMQYLPAR